MVWLRHGTRVNLNLYNWPDRTTAHFALMRSDGVATTWYSSQSNLEHTWVEWTEILHKTFLQRECFLGDILIQRKIVEENLDIVYEDGDDDKEENNVDGNDVDAMEKTMK